MKSWQIANKYPIVIKGDDFGRTTRITGANLRFFLGCALIQFVTSVAPAQTESPKSTEHAVSPFTVNRTVPLAPRPNLELKFSASPTTAEITKARVLDEPLLPVGGNPTIGENAALSKVLVQYSQKTGVIKSGW